MRPDRENAIVSIAEAINRNGKIAEVLLEQGDVQSAIFHDLLSVGEWCITANIKMDEILDKLNQLEQKLS